MPSIRISEPADLDIKSIWRYTIERYDDEQAYRYMGLLDVALDDIAQDPESVVARRLPEYGDHIWMRPLSASKRSRMTSVQAPRHVIVYSLELEGVANILRVLHDSMDIENQLEPYSE